MNKKIENERMLNDENGLNKEKTYNPNREIYLVDTHDSEELVYYKDNLN